MKFGDVVWILRWALKKQHQRNDLKIKKNGEDEEENVKRSELDLQNRFPSEKL